MTRAALSDVHASIGGIHTCTREGVEAVSVRLSGVAGQPRAQLDGFRTRVVRLEGEAPAQRHVYLTEWRLLDAAEAQNGATTLVIADEALPVECARLSSRVSQHELTAKLRAGASMVMVTAVAAQRVSVARLPLFALEVALAPVGECSSTASTAVLRRS